MLQVHTYANIATIILLCNFIELRKVANGKDIKANQLTSVISCLVFTAKSVTFNKIDFIFTIDSENFPAVVN